MVRYILTLILFFVSSSFITAQECYENPGIFQFLSILGSGDDDDDDNDDDDYQYDTGPDIPYDSLRTENTEIRFGINFLAPTGIDGLNPAGLELAFYREEPGSPGLYLGASFSFYNHGLQSYDTLFGEYDRINTSNNMYGISMHMKQRVIDTDWIKGYFGLQAGMLIFHSFSRAVDLSCDCDREPAKTLQSKLDVRPNIGPTLDLQFPVGSKYDRFNIHVGYLFTGKTSFVKKGDVEIAPNRVNFRETNKQLGLINIQIGYSIFF